MMLDDDGIDDLFLDEAALQRREDERARLKLLGEFLAWCLIALIAGAGMFLVSYLGFDFQRFWENLLS